MLKIYKKLNSELQSPGKYLLEKITVIHAMYECMQQEERAEREKTTKI